MNHTRATLPRWFHLNPRCTSSFESFAIFLAWQDTIAIWHGRLKPFRSAIVADYRFARVLTAWGCFPSKIRRVSCSTSRVGSSLNSENQRYTGSAWRDFCEIRSEVGEFNKRSRSLTAERLLVDACATFAIITHGLCIIYMNFAIEATFSKDKLNSSSYAQNP